MSVHTPPLSRSGSSPSSVGLANRSSPPAAPPTSLSLRSSYNQLLGHDVIKESPTAMEMGSSATLPKSRHRYAMTSSSSSSALYSSSSSSLFSTNPKLAKNGANLQKKAETQQQEQSKTTTEVKEQDDIITPIHSSDWMEGENDNSQAPPPFCRRTKSFLEFHEKEEDPPKNKIQSCPPPQGREDALTQAQGHPHSVETPPKPPRSAQAPPPRVIKVELHPNNENPYLHRPPSASHKQPRGEESIPLLLQTLPSSFSPDPERGSS
ncbi:unnamed protein product, partial [Coregonus sp. 'balchen']